jgi:hypothetical protein
MMTPAKLAPNASLRSIAESTFLSGLYVSNLIKPEDVVRVLNAAGVKFVLAGAHGIGCWTGQPRATKDVDVIVGKRHAKKAVTALVGAFPHLVVEEEDVVTRLRDPETKEVAIDVMKPAEPVVAAALKNCVESRAGQHAVQIPNAEMALALKFAAMVNPNRPDDKKYIDAADFIRIVRQNPAIDSAKLPSLGELVYSGGGAEILELIRRVRAGEKLML